MDEKQKRIFDDSLLQYSLKRAYLDNKVFSNWVLVDNNGVPVKPVSESFEIINNKDLLNKLSEFSAKPKILQVERNPQKDTFFYRGYFPNAIPLTDSKNNTLFIGFEVGNTFADKFFPFAKITLYHYTAGLHIRTGINLLDNFTRSNFNDTFVKNFSKMQELLKSIIERKDTPSITCYDILRKYLPKKLSHHLTMMDNLINNPKYEFMLGFSVIAKEWEKTSYEYVVKVNHELLEALWEI